MDANVNKSNLLPLRKQLEWLPGSCAAMLFFKGNSNTEVEFLMEEIEHKVVLEQQCVEQIERQQISLRLWILLL